MQEKRRLVKKTEGPFFYIMEKKLDIAELYLLMYKIVSNVLIIRDKTYRRLRTTYIGNL